MLRRQVTCDGATIWFAIAGGRMAVPIANVRAVTVRTGERTYFDIDLGQPFRRSLVRSRECGLDVSVDGGHLRVFANSDPLVLNDIASEIRRRLGVPEAIAKDGLPTARLGRSFGRGRWASLSCGLGLGVACCAVAGRTLWLAERAQAWPTVTATVTQSTYVAGSESAQVDFEYTYSVGNHTYTGDRIGFWRDNPDRIVWDTVTSHPVRSLLRVHVRPGHPDESVVVPGPSLIVWAIIATGASLIALTAPLAFGWPAAGEAALAQRYLAGWQDAFKGGPLVLNRWRAPDDVVAVEARQARKAQLLMATRIVFLTALCVWGIWWWAEPRIGSEVPTRQTMLALLAMTAFPPGLLALAALLPLGRPAELRLTVEGFERPGAKLVRTPWGDFVGHSVDPHPMVRDRRVLVLRRRKGQPYRLPLPVDGAADDILKTVASRLPRDTPREG